MSVALASVQTAIDELRVLLGDRLSTSTGVRDHHSKDESWHIPHRPDAVAFPTSTEEVAQIVQICARHRTPVVAYGTGTSLEGNVIPENGGVVVDLMHMDKVLKVNSEDLDVTVQARVTRKQLNDYIRDQGLFFPIDPGADASLGGMAATRASGTNAVRYGTMRENVLALTVVLADGRIIRTARRARKSAAGYDLTRLFVGSEGTLGIITEVTLRLYGIPEAMAAAVCSFDTLEGAVNTVIQTIQLGIPVARIELLDSVQMDSVNKFSKLELSGQGHPVHRVPRHRDRREGAGRDGAGDRFASTAAASSSGPPGRKSAPTCGRRATTSPTPTRRCARAARSGPPTCACRSRGWPSASSRPRRTCKAASSWRRWSDTSATATSTSAS